MQLSITLLRVHKLWCVCQYIFILHIDIFIQVQTHLENPTTYHLQQSRDKKVRDYLSDTYGNKFAAHLSPHRLSPKPPPAPPSPANRTARLSSSAGNSAPNSPLARMNLCSNPEREVSTLGGVLLSASYISVYIYNMYIYKHY